MIDSFQTSPLPCKEKVFDILFWQQLKNHRKKADTLEAVIYNWQN